MGDRLDFLRKALIRLEETDDVFVEAVSSVYETEPVGYRKQPDFLNLAVRIDTALSPEHLLSELQRIEKDLGRKRTRRFGPRTIDIDILLFENQERNDDRLSIPHPRMRQRAFVLIPLRDVMPDMNEAIPEDAEVRYFCDLDMHSEDRFPGSPAKVPPDLTKS
jgi:2-amino-4-hydroxy-6-hydroxymethyldihydropteridine diphosphokinase